MALLEGIRKAISQLSIHPGRSSSAQADLLNLSKRNVDSIQNLLSGTNPLNSRQCMHLSLKVSKTVHSIQELVFLCGRSTHVFRLALENLYRILEKAKLLVARCCEVDWITEAVFQIGNAQDFQLILLEVGLCYHAIYEQAKEYIRDALSFQQCEDLRNTSTFSPVNPSEVGKDQDDLKRRLEVVRSSLHNSPKNSVEDLQHCLARYLLVAWECMSQKSEIDELDLSTVMSCMKDIGSTRKAWGRDRAVGNGSFGSVYRSKWLGTRCAKKVFYGNPDKSSLLKEAGLLFRLNHPNIVKFFCCGNGEGQGDCFIAMELMETNLAHLIRGRAKRGDPFALSVAIEIMVQIACAMWYLHDMGVAHRDLKPDNVVVNRLTADHTMDVYCVKLVDFGLSKVKVESSKPSCMTIPGMGTAKYRAPEAHPDAHPDRDFPGKVDWFKADVYSFGITCAHLLSLQEPFEDMREYVKLMSGSRPEIPATCPERLVALLNSCWDTSPQSRPNFREICIKLEGMRHEVLRGLGSSYVGSEQFIRAGVELHYSGAGRQAYVESTDEVIELKPTSDSIITSGMENMDKPITSALLTSNVSYFHSMSSKESLSVIDEDMIMLGSSVATDASISRSTFSVEPLHPRSTSTEDDTKSVGNHEGGGFLEEEAMRESKRALPLAASTSVMSGIGGTSRTRLESEVDSRVQSGSDSLSQFDVFLNHREPDLKKTFVSHLSAALRRAGRSPFMDGKSLMKGHHRFHSIDGALSGVLVHVAVFSTGYAESKYCLNELCDMLASSRPLIPVFYNVEPSDLTRTNTGPFAEAFHRHLKRGRGADVHRWQSALREVAGIMGFVLRDFYDNVELEEKIVAAVLDAIREMRGDNLAREGANSLKQYDVYLHHRGPDVKMSFASQLYAGLRRAGCSPFLDVKSVARGRHLFHSMQEALDSVLVHVAIFSPRFAESRYCLDEVCDMLATKKPVIPVFYNVESRDLQMTNTGPFAKAFHRHLKRGRGLYVPRWQSALREVANISGFGLVDCENDTVQLEEKIVAAVLLFKSSFSEGREGSRCWCDGFVNDLVMTDGSVGQSR